ncbi:hypothetical protein KBY82_07355 [Cyanobium sp. AMD-g]|nr:hypothetical protein [Cyanobium sp. AMD-g]MCP9930595.1 hypothetical protein [Cyanobium sp. AMD-g]
MAELENDQALALAVWLTSSIHVDGIDAAEKLAEVLGVEGLLGFEPEP